MKKLALITTALAVFGAGMWLAGDHSKPKPEVTCPMPEPMIESAPAPTPAPRPKRPKPRPTVKAPLNVLQ